jgi:phage-related minor tail protein
VAGGGSYIVGERGPELFTPGVSGNITPNGGAGGGSVVVHNHIDSRSDQATIAMATQRAVQQALSSLNNNLRRGGSFARQVGIA